MRETVSLKQARAFEERMAEMAGLKSGALFRFLRQENTPAGLAEKQNALARKFRHENFLMLWLEAYWKQYQASFERLRRLQRRIEALSEKSSILINSLEQTQSQGGLKCRKNANAVRSQSICHISCIRGIAKNIGTTFYKIGDGVKTIPDLLKKVQSFKNKLDKIDQEFIRPALAKFENNDWIAEHELQALEKNMDVIEKDVDDFDISAFDAENQNDLKPVIDVRDIEI